MYFVSKSFREERVQVFLSEKELNKLREYSPNIFKKSNIDHYMELPGATFSNENTVFYTISFL